MLGAGQGERWRLPGELRRTVPPRWAACGPPAFPIPPPAAGTAMKRAQSRALPYLLLAPSLVFLAAIFLLPLVQTIALSFSEGGAA